ncbi:hypothetical protein ECANGB1_1599 [Enterospora canceri]|uniref:Uncharacterized protein n=1 Tax=Enterospora canceri TaxID=1081671 RepID=A0A1Y1S5P0_9MICR|nr:hypothetical protein ECANGB1_1599 [Enterospora canceri]
MTCSSALHFYYVTEYNIDGVEPGETVSYYTNKVSQAICDLHKINRIIFQSHSELSIISKMKRNKTTRSRMGVLKGYVMETKWNLAIIDNYVKRVMIEWSKVDKSVALKKKKNEFDEKLRQIDESNALFDTEWNKLNIFQVE